MEVVSLIGNIVMNEKAEHVVHAHATLGLPDGSACAGDEESGIALIDANVVHARLG